MERPLVTVFMPVYNCEEYIAESMESILNQTYKKLEILLVDDGSTDDSTNIINSYDDQRIRLIKNATNRGIPFTRNVGLEHATGKYMVIMDSDDIAVPDRIEKQVAYLEENKNIDVVGSYYLKFGTNINRKIKSVFTSPEEIKMMILFYNPIANPSSTVRLKTLETHDIKYNSSYFVAQDYGLWAQLSKVGEISILPEFLLQYRTGHDNITKRSKKEKLDKRKQIINVIHEDILNYYKVDYSDDELEVYNDFFSENNRFQPDLPRLEIIVNKLKAWNEHNNVFDKVLFLKVLNKAILLSLFNKNIGLKQKLAIYNKLATGKNGYDLFYIVIKHVYHLIKS